MSTEDVSRIVEEHAGKPGGLIGILQEIQARYGYLPPDALGAVAEGIGRSLTDVCGVATFFRSFSLKPRGKHVCSVCLGTACHVRGGKAVLTEMENKLGIKEGETTKDLSVTLETVGCVGCCALAPVATVNDQDLYGELTPKMVDDIIHTVRSEHGTHV